MSIHSEHSVYSQQQSPNHHAMSSFSASHHLLSGPADLCTKCPPAGRTDLALMQAYILLCMLCTRLRSQPTTKCWTGAHEACHRYVQTSDGSSDRRPRSSAEENASVSVSSPSGAYNMFPIFSRDAFCVCIAIRAMSDTRSQFCSIISSRHLNLS
jgi:hypothetical protein